MLLLESERIEQLAPNSAFTKAGSRRHSRPLNLIEAS